MQFNDTTNKSGIIQRCEWYTGLGDGNISGNSTLLKQFTAAINQYYNKVLTLILKSQDEWDFDDKNYTDFPILTTNLVANQQDYQLPSKTLKLKRVEITYDGTNWYKAEPFDIGEKGGDTSTTSIANDFVKTEPYYDIIGNSIFLYPIPDSDVTNGLRVWIMREPDYFSSSDTTQEPGFDEPFHEMLAIGASMDYAIAKRLPQKSDLMTLWADYELKIQNYYGSKQQDRELVMRASYQDYGEPDY